MSNKQVRKSLKDYSNASSLRAFLQKETNNKFTHIDQFSFLEEDVQGRNIENLVGAIQVPLGIVGPVKLPDSSKDYYVPLATTEGALVASTQRGLKAIYLSGGAQITIEEVGMTRGPLFKTSGIKHNEKIKLFLKNHFPLLQKVAEKTSHHLKLLNFTTTSSGKNLFIRFHFDTQDAMGMNMATFATQEMVKVIEQHTKAKCLSVAGNYDIDKKPAWLNFIEGRGRKVSAQVIIKKEVVNTVLKVTPEQIADLVYRKCHIGSELAGSLGFNAHFANIIAAIFLATGQDIAQVVEGSLGMTTAEVESNGDLYFSIYLPSLLAGTVGGGTQLPTQQEALKIMGIKKSGDIIRYCQLLGCAVLAGELSLIASLAQGSLSQAHKKLGRKQA